MFVALLGRRIQRQDGRQDEGAEDHAGQHAVAARPQLPLRGDGTAPILAADPAVAALTVSVVLVAAAAAFVAALAAAAAALVSVGGTAGGVRRNDGGDVTPSIMDNYLRNLTQCYIVLKRHRYLVQTQKVKCFLYMCYDCKRYF